MSSSSAASSPLLRATIQEVADTLARHDFEESSMLYALVGLVPVDGSAGMGIEVGPLNERLCDHCIAKGFSCYSHLDAMPATACYSCKLARKGCSLSAGIVSNAERLRVDAEHHSAPSGSRAHIPQMCIEIVDEGEDAPPSSPEVALRPLSGSPGSGLPAPDPDVTTTRPRSRQMAPAVDNAEVGPSKSTPEGEKRLCDGEEGMLPPKRVRFQVPGVGSRVFDANDPSQLLGVVASILTRPPPPPSSAPSASEDHSLQEQVTAMEVRQAHLEVHIGALEHNGQVFQAWVAAQQYENQAFRRALEAQATEFREMVAVLTCTIDQDRSSTARELRHGCLFQSTAYPTLHLAERYFLDHPSVCASPLEDYPLYGCTDEMEGCAEAGRDHEPTGRDGGEDFGEWRKEEEEESEGWGLNDDEREYVHSLARLGPTDSIRRPRSSSAESSDCGSYSEPEDAEREDSENECDRALVVDEEEGDDSSSSVDSSEEEANALIDKYAPHDVALSLL
ncbi:hypothetical protein NEOLEDRAFT_1184647 [Neolentinus lepideus HHB14362 ss-1]|uniref:Uncharacterized protein n=1 Tax=Neolentinus lepideus HHB14362 ss-1 TaxID=1314782 RepID=A0A165M8E8_9AGAM|nr:hypothetical protein NEOLEDRAFT_1184647 [Neolentinus lepideus HHB14362 ss-1]